MVQIRLRFVAGRYHATPWGRHVNEGVPEWPPSPWRLLRALVSCWLRACPETACEDILSLVDALANSLPVYVLPEATVGHARYRMPVSNAGGSDRPLVIDTFVALAKRSEIQVIWPDTRLSDTDRRTLSHLLGRLGYLGRAESWVEATADYDVVSQAKVNCVPIGPGGEVPEGFEPVRVLTPDKGIRGPELLDALSVDTGTMRSRDKLLDPKGSRSVVYLRRRDCFDVDYVPGSFTDCRPRMTQEPMIARFAIYSVPRPMVTETLAIAELARRSAMAMYGRLNDGAASSTLSGKDPSGQPLTGHLHAYYLPTDEDDDGRLDHLTITATRGFSSMERSALSKLGVLNPGGGRPEIKMVLLGIAPSQDFRLSIPWLRESTVWESRTPFLLVRHPKTRRNGEPKCSDDGTQIDGPESQLMAEWEQFRAIDPMLPRIVSMKRIPCLIQRGHRLSWLEFRRWRSKGDGPAIERAYGFRIELDSPAKGPVALGYGCHFGLGQFHPCRSEASTPILGPSECDSIGG